MATNTTKDQIIKLLRTLEIGCKKHPAYRAIRPATGRCEPCVIMWNARKSLEAIEASSWDSN